MHSENSSKFLELSINIKIQLGRFGEFLKIKIIGLLLLFLINANSIIPIVSQTTDTPLIGEAKNLDVDKMMFNPANNNIAFSTAGDPNQIFIFTKFGEQLAPIQEQSGSIEVWSNIMTHDDSIVDLQYTRDGSYLISYSKDGVIKKWNGFAEYQTKKVNDTLSYEGGYTYMKIYQNKYIAVRTDDWNVKFNIYDLSTLNLVKKVDIPLDEFYHIKSFDWSNDGKKFYILGYGSDNRFSLRTIDIDTNQISDKVDLSDRSTTTAYYVQTSHNGSFLGVSTDFGLFLYKTSNMQQLHKFDADKKSLDFSSNNMVIAGTKNTKVYLWSLISYGLITSFDTNMTYTPKILSYSVDGKALAVSDYFSIQFYNVADYLTSVPPAPTTPADLISFFIVISILVTLKAKKRKI